MTTSALYGKRIAVTRAANQAPALGRQLRARGAIPIDFPCIAIQALRDPARLDQLLHNLHSFDLLVLTSSNAVAAMSDRLRALDLQPDWSALRIAALGPATAKASEDLLNRKPDFLPASPSGDCLARSLPLAPGERVFLPQSALADEKTAQILRERGVEVSATVAYHTVMGSGGRDLPAMIKRGEIDALTFVSPSALRYFRQRCQLPAALDLPAACIGPATASAAAELGFRRIVAPESASLEAMLEALAAHFADGARG